MSARLGLWSGVGLVVANMVGAGIFLSAGFMAQDLLPIEILLAWVIGAVLAMCGATAYAAIAEIVPRSGGEYRYLSDLLHPFLGYAAGWASLLVGFAGPIAIDAYAAGAFAQKLGSGADPKLVGAAVILLLVAFHAVSHKLSKSAQNAMVILKVALVAGFLVIGIFFGEAHLPDWRPPGERSGFPLEAFTGSLFFIAYAFSGWNAAIYASEEFERPKLDVPRAMLIGAGAVGVVYLLANAVLIANVTPEDARVVFAYDTERVTLAHVVVAKLLGPGAAKVASAALLIALVSAASAMMLVGPRVYVAMAKDGFLPRSLVGPEGRPPLRAIVLQGVVALVILFTHGLQEVLQNVGAVLTLFSGLTALSLFYVTWKRSDLPRVAPVRLVAAAVYVLSACFMFYTGLKRSSTFWIWAGAFFAIATVAYVATRRRRAPVSDEVRGG